MAKRVTRQGWSQCAGGGGLGSEQELSPPTFSSLLPMGSETMSRFTEVERVPQICIDTDPFPRMLDDALECQVQVSSHRHHQWLPYRKPPAMPEAIVCKGDASSGERLLFSATKTNSHWNLPDFSKSTIKVHTLWPRYHVTMQVQKAPGDGDRVGGRNEVVMCQRLHLMSPNNARK